MEMFLILGEVEIFAILGYVIYVCLFLIALWGAFCVVMVFARVKQKRFENEETQTLFMEAIEEPLSQGDYATASEICADDRRAMCQFCLLYTSPSPRDLSTSRMPSSA